MQNISIKEMKENATYKFMQKKMIECFNETFQPNSKIVEDAVDYDPNGPMCPRAFDGFMCWNETPASATAYQSCPGYVVGFDPTRFAYKKCLDNATFSGTDYTTCVDVEDLKFRTIVNNIYVYGYIISIIALLISVGIFLYYKTLHCIRIRIHMHLFCAITLNNILWIMWYKMVVNHPEVLQENKIWCQALHIANHYLMVASYFWMFTEALNLHIALVVVFVREKCAMRAFVIIGWILSFLDVLAYSLVRHFYNRDTERCWIDDSRSFLIISTPVIISIFSSFVFLVNVIRILVTKLHPVPCQNVLLALRKSARATFILIPLFGLHFILIPFRPDLDSPYENSYSIFSAIITSLQGVCVSVIFCFTNHDVRAATRGHLSRVVRANEHLPMTGITGGESVNAS